MVTATAHGEPMLVMHPSNKECGSEDPHPAEECRMFEPPRPGFEP
jgi:hypothetical protein